MNSAAARSSDAKSAAVNHPDAYRAVDCVAGESAVHWRIWLAAERPRQAWAVATVVIVILLWAVLVFHSVWVGIAGAIVALGAVKEYIAPLDYRLDTKGASVNCCGIAWVSIPWADVRSVYRTPAGLKLSPYDHPMNARTESLRGLVLRFAPARAPQIERDVTRLSGRAAGGAASL